MEAATTSIAAINASIWSRPLNDIISASERALFRAFADDPHAKHALRERARFGATTLPCPTPTMALDVRDDVAAGLRWVLDFLDTTTVVAIPANGGTAHGFYLDANSLARATAWAKRKNDESWNLYFTMNQPRVNLAAKPKKSDITHIRAAAYADIDAKDGRTMEEAFKVVRSLPPATVVIASGGGFQPIWCFSDPLPATPECVASVEARSERIAVATDGDPVGNVDRILRLPFTVNYPNKGKRAAGRIVCLSGLLLPDTTS